MKLELIDTGYFYADGGAMFGAIPKTAWSHRYPCNKSNGCILAMRSLLITTDTGRVILIDTGAGTKQLEKLSYYQFFNLTDLHTELKKRSIQPEQVTDVILTHLHFDHCGYVTLQSAKEKELTMAFPQATHWISQSQWGNFLAPNPLEKESFFIENMQTIEQAGQLQLISSDFQIDPSVSLKIFDGHTTGQIAPYVYTQEQTFIFAGDVIPLAANVSPTWISAYDTHPVTSYTEKKRMLEEATTEKQAIIYCHDAYTHCTTIKKINGFYKKDRIITVR